MVAVVETKKVVDKVVQMVENLEHYLQAVMVIIRIVEEVVQYTTVVGEEVLIQNQEQVVGVHHFMVTHR